MARIAPPISTRFPSLDNEPKMLGGYIQSGPPPAYHSHTETDSWSDYTANSSNNNTRKHRASWTNLVDSNENLNKYKVNHYPKVHGDAPTNIRPSDTKVFGSANQISTHSMSRQNSQISDFGQYPAGPKGQHPVFSEPNPPPPPHTQHRRPYIPPIELETTTTRPTVPVVKRNRLQEIRNWCSRPWNVLLCLGLLLALVIGAVVAIVLSQVFALPRDLQMSWQAPEALRNGQAASNGIQMDVQGQRIRFNLRGATPFKGNFISYYDFPTNRIVVIDESLNNNGKNLACFLLTLNRQNMPNVEAVQKAAANSKNRMQMTTGWNETWMFQPTPTTMPPIFNPPIGECNGTRWIQLDFTPVNQQQQRCTECHDFCLPEFGIDNDPTKNEQYLNIARRDCFHLFVPEWRTYAQANTMEQNQRDFENFYRNRNRIGIDSSQSKWIPLAGVQSGNTGIADPNSMMTTMAPYGSGTPYGSGMGGMQPNMPNMGMQGGQMMPNTLGGVITDVRQGAQNAIGGLGNTLGQGVNSIGQSAQNLQQGLTQSAQNLGQNIGQGVQNLGQGLNQGVQNVASGISQTGQNVGQSVSNLGSNLFGQANQAVNGVVNLPGSQTNSPYGTTSNGYSTSYTYGGTMGNTANGNGNGGGYGNGNGNGNGNGYGGSVGGVDSSGYSVNSGNSNMPGQPGGLLAQTGPSPTGYVPDVVRVDVQPGTSGPNGLTNVRNSGSAGGYGSNMNNNNNNMGFNPYPGSYNNGYGQNTMNQQSGYSTPQQGVIGVPQNNNGGGYSGDMSQMQPNMMVRG